MSESTEATEVEAKVDEPTPEAAEAVATEVVEAPVEADAGPAAQAEVPADVTEVPAAEVKADEATVDAPEGEPVIEAVADEAEALAVEPVEEAPVPADVVAAEMSTVRQARVFLCERGHRVTALWKTPEVCQGRITRTGPVCGRPLYPMAELPEQVQKALNPLKASKKSSKKK